MTAYRTKDGSEKPAGHPVRTITWIHFDEFDEWRTSADTPDMNNHRILALVAPIFFASVSCTQLAKSPTTPSTPTSASKDRSGESECRSLIERPFPDADQKLKAIFESHWENAILESPEFATYLGDPRGQNRLSDQSKQNIEQNKALTRCQLDLIRSVKRESLSNDRRKLDYDIFLDSLERSVEQQKFPGELLGLTQMGGPHTELPQVLLSMRAMSEQDYEDRLARLELAPKWIEQQMALLQEGLAKGITPPKSTLKGVPKQIEALLSPDPKTNPLMRSFDDMPATLSREKQEKLRARAITLVRERVIPAFKTLHEYVKGPYLAGAREPIAASTLPNGEEWYRSLVRTYTTTTLSADEVHQIGLDEVSRLNREMDQAMKDAGWNGDRASFFRFLRSDPRFFFTKAEDLLAGYRDIAKRADAQLTKLFGKLPRSPYGIKAIPSFSAAQGPQAYYESGSLSGGRPGWFVANTHDLKSRPKWEMEPLTLHEAVPGHHLQISIAQELEDVPNFRRHAGYTAYSEGWGLYAESLGDEMGFYRDPYAKVGRITYEMWRACRLVVDTGIHSKGWSRQKAIDFMAAQMPKPRHDIESEVDRYIVWPGQATAYKIGELKIKQLRARAQERLKDRFDVRAFHDRILADGSLPLAVLEKRVDEWTQSQLK